jgi:hypothetical protein
MNNFIDYIIAFSTHFKYYQRYKPYREEYTNLYNKFIKDVEYNDTNPQDYYLMDVIELFYKFLINAKEMNIDIDKDHLQNTYDLIDNADTFLANKINDGVKFNRCVECFAFIGNDNPRQYCAKTHCSWHH